MLKDTYYSIKAHFAVNNGTFYNEEIGNCCYSSILLKKPMTNMSQDYS